MISHMVHFIYEVVDHTAEEAARERPGPDEGIGKFIVWAAAIGGALYAGQQAVDLYATTSVLGAKDYAGAFTEEHLPAVIAVAGAGAIGGACLGLLVWALIAFVFTRISP